MELLEAMRTTPSTREFTDDPVPDDVLYKILDDARFAPNGGNRQAWRVIVVRDPATKQRIAELYDLGMREYAAHNAAGLVPFVAAEAHTRTEPAVDLEEARRTPVALDTSYLATAPVMLVILVDLTALPAVDSGLDRLSISAGASVYPLAHNILLAARCRIRRSLHHGARASGARAPRAPRHPEDVRARHNAPARQADEGDHQVAARQGRGPFTTVERFDGPAFERA